MTLGIAIRALAPAEVGTAIDWAAQEGWNPGLEDADPFRSVDPRGFLGLFFDDALAACISALAYDEGFAFIGFYICRKDMRGNGYGLQLWKAALTRLGDRTVGLDGVVAQQANYAASGFAPAHRNIRYTGRPSAAGPPTASIVDVGESHVGLVEAIIDYDRGCFPAPRAAFVRRWIRRTSTRRTVAFVERRSVRGYGTVRACREGFKIGPLFADDAQIAAAILEALLSPCSGAEATLDIPEPNDAARQLAERYRMSPTFETLRMYRNGFPTLPLAGVFGITSFELG